MKILFDDNYFMGQAIQEAKKAYFEGEIPVGAVVTINQRIIARAHNSTAVSYTHLTLPTILRV